MKKLSNKKLLHVALCGILSGGLAGCSGEGGGYITDRAWQGSSCDSAQNIDLLTGLNAEDDVDGLVAFRLGVQIGPYSVVMGGAPCSEALDVDSCSVLLDEATNDYLPFTLIVTAGDDVRTLSGKSEVLAFLGPIDTQQKAMLWMQVNNMDITCNAAESAVAVSSDGGSWFGLYTEMTRDCAPIVTEQVEVSISADGLIEEINRRELSRHDGACVGRIPPGKLTIMGEQACKESLELGAMFAKHAAYEAASVVAFTHLKEELETYGAPLDLIERVIDAANDEVRHAEQVGALAQRYGCNADTFTVEPSPIRSLEEIAFDNMSEGCVGETWGALVGLYQADHALHSDIRDTMKAIAEDEVGHAALSWEIHQWLYPQLSADARSMLDRKMLKAVARLKQKVSKSARTDLELIVGLPSASISQALVQKLGKMFELNAMAVAC